MQVFVLSFYLQYWILLMNSSYYWPKFQENHIIMSYLVILGFNLFGKQKVGLDSKQYDDKQFVQLKKMVYTN